MKVLRVTQITVGSREARPNAWEGKRARVYGATTLWRRQNIHPHQKIEHLFRCSIFWYDNENMKGFEGGSRFARAKRFALRNKDNETHEGKGGN